MALLRLFILAILIYLLFYLLLGFRKKKKRISGKEQTDGEPSSSVNDVLIEDPICHKLVPKGQAVRLRNDGQTIYFCSEECCEIFEKKQEENE